MKSPRRLRFPAALAVALLAAAASDATATDVVIKSWRYPVLPAPSFRAGPGIMGPGGATKIKIIVDETGPVALLGAPGILAGGNLSCTILSDAPACTTAGSATIEAVQPADDDTATVTWSYACVNPGDCVTLQLSTSKGPLVVRRSFWGNAIQDSIVPTEGCARMPGTSPLGIGVLVALIALWGAWVVLRREPARA